MDDYVWESYNLSAKGTRSRSYLLLSWRFLLGWTAFLDFVATVLPPLLRAAETEEEYELWGHPIPDVPFGRMLQFLHQHCGIIGFAFSLMWFLEAFLDASRSRENTLLERDRQKLMSQAHKCNDDDDDFGSINVLDDLGYLDDNWDSWLAFYFRLIFQLMLLPTGFYILVKKGLYELSIWDGDEGHIETMLDHELTGYTFQRERNLALGIALLQKLLDAVLEFASEKGLVLKKLAVKEISHIVRGVLTSAILHPRQFAKRMKSALTTIRWIKYIQPIFGATNKLKGNLQDLWKKRRQHKEMCLLQKARRHMFRQLTTKEQRELAARQIQSCFRSYHVRKRIRAMKLFTAQKETLAAIRLQAIFRRKLEEARKRLKLKKIELAKLKKKAEMELWKKTQQQKITRMTPEERLRLYQLEEELQSETVKILNRRMLLKPNTRFSVAWKLLFVFCVIFEITGLVLNPILKKHKHNGEPLRVHTAVKNILVPLPVSELEVCHCKRPKGWRATMLRWKHHQQTPQTCGPFPWYCEAPYSSIRGVYIPTMNFLIDDFLVLVAWVVFLDVPISFLTGEFDESGMLMPKPFFQRWILPGLVLQLLVNPKMKTTCDYVKDFIHFLFDVGIVRFWRWHAALFYPLFMTIVELMERLWVQIVEDQNHKTVFDEARSRVMGKHKELVQSVAALNKKKLE